MNGPSKVEPVHTTLRVEGANCSFCFNAAIDEIGRTDGVFEVHGSMAAPSIEIAHDHTVSVEALSQIVRDRVHGVEMFANEIRMVPLHPTAAQPECGHA